MLGRNWRMNSGAGLEHGERAPQGRSPALHELADRHMCQPAERDTPGRGGPLSVSGLPTPAWLPLTGGLGIAQQLGHLSQEPQFVCVLLFTGWKQVPDSNTDEHEVRPDRYMCCLPAHACLLLSSRYHSAPHTMQLVTACSEPGRRPWCHLCEQSWGLSLKERSGQQWGETFRSMSHVSTALRLDQTLECVFVADLWRRSS